MRRLILAAVALGLIVPVSFVAPSTQAEARKNRRYVHRYQPRRCTHSGGTTGAVVGGVGGALVGNSVFGHGALGTIAGAAGGALGGRAVDRTITAKRRCR